MTCDGDVGHRSTMENNTCPSSESATVPSIGLAFVQDRNPLSALSTRELDVVQELVNGRSTDSAAAVLYISRHTFRTHVKNISRKLNTHSSLELVSLAVEHGMRPSRLIA